MNGVMNHWTFRAFIFPLCVVILSGCDLLVSNEEQAFRICETHIKEQLRSPATYVRVKAIADVGQPGKNIRTVHIEYDASNAFGTPVRGVEGCAFEVDEDGEFPARSRMELGASEAALDRSQKLLAQLQGKRKSGDLDGLYSCCISGEARDRAMKNYRENGDFSFASPVSSPAP